MRADRDCCLTGVILRRADRSCGIPLEVEQPERQHARLQHLFAEPFGDRAEILSDDEASIAHALEGENAQELLKGIVDIAALGRPLACRNPEEPHQFHDVIDAQGAGVTHIGAQQVDEGLKASGAQRDRIPGRQAPILASQIPGVRRRANAHAPREQCLVLPNLSAGTVHADRQILVKPDSHPQ